MNTPNKTLESAVSTGEARLRQAMETYREAIKSLAAVTGADILAAFCAAFDENPLVKAIVWEQYTPYFRDGEECVFELSGESGKMGRSTLPDPEVWDRTDEYDSYRRVADEDSIFMPPESWTWIVGRAPTATETEEINATVFKPELPGFDPEPDTEETDVYTETIKTPNPNPRTTWDTHTYTHVKHELVPDAKRQRAAVESLLRSIPLKLLEHTFGDHAIVFVWRGGIAVRHVSHS